MQALIDLVGGFVGSVQKTIAMVLLAGLALSAIIALTIYGTAPVIAEEAGDRVESFADARIEEAVEEGRAAKCDQLRARAAVAWNDAVNSGAEERAYAQIDELDRQAERYCTP